jgi:PAS domain S-box-containing protein
VKRISIYIIFSVSAILGFVLLVQTLDEDAVRELESTFNEQQAVQVDLASRSMEEQFSWQIHNVEQVAHDLNAVVEFLYFYDSTGKRLLYSARSVNQVSPEALEARLTDIIASSPQNNTLMWGFIGDDQHIFIPSELTDSNNSSYQQQLTLWFDTHQESITQSETIFVSPIYASSTGQYVGVFHHVTSLGGYEHGYIATVIDLSRMIDQFIKPVRSGQYGAAWIQDIEGYVIFDHEVEIIGENVYDLHANYPVILELDRRYIVELSGTGEYSFTVQRGSEIRRKLVAWNTAYLGNQQLTVALSAPDTEISALLTTSRQTSLFLGAILTILLVGSGGIFYYYQQTELRRLVKERTAELEREHKQLQLEIADREKAEIALRISETNFRQLAENIREVFILFDMHTNQIVYVSPSYTDIWHRDINLLYKTPFSLILTIYPEDRSLVHEQLKAFFDNPTVLSITFRIVRGDGEIRWIRWRAFPIGTSNLIDRVICTAEDVTATKQAREAEVFIEIERKRAQLLANFVQDAFHEFRTPLSIINTSVFLLGNINEEQKRQEYLQFIREESGNIMHLVEQLVTMARLDVNEPFRDDLIHIDTMMSDLKITTEPDIYNTELKATWKLNAESCYIRGDQEQLHRAIKNIIQNAIKYSNVGDQLFISTTIVNQTVIVEIADTGEGISPQQIENIFERFYRVDKAHSTRGFGLGLPITQRIIERHQGTITAQSTQGEGAVFQIQLPLEMEETLKWLKQSE